MPLEVIYFTPHGMQIIPGLEDPYNEKFRPLHNAMMKLSNDIGTRDLDYLILLTPHGLALENQFGVVNNDKLRGYLPYLTRSNVDGDTNASTLEVPGDSNISGELVTFLKEQGISSSSMVFGAKSYPFPLAWGETVPLHYLESGLSLQIPVVVVSIPQLRYEMELFFPIMRKFGQILHEFLHNSPDRYGLVLSGDLSHVHQEKSPFGYHPSGKLFDRAICQYTQSLDSDLLQNIINNYAKTALACGLANLVVLDEVTRYATNKNDSKNKCWINVIFEYAAPTYFGMVVASYILTQDH